MGRKKSWATTPSQQMFAGNGRLAKRSSARASVAPNRRNVEITGREPSVHTSCQQTCRTAAAELTTPTAESGFNGDRNVTLLASTSPSGCRQHWVTAADAGRAVKPANTPENSLRWKVTGWLKKKKKDETMKQIKRQRFQWQAGNHLMINS